MSIRNLIRGDDYDPDQVEKILAGAFFTLAGLAVLSSVAGCFASVAEIVTNDETEKQQACKKEAKALNATNPAPNMTANCIETEKGVFNVVYTP